MQFNEEQNQQASVTVNSQYIKDFSFESPLSPVSLLLQEQPSINIALDINAKAIQEHTFEVVLKIKAEAKNSNETIFLTELDYAGVFTVPATDEQELEMALLVYCPNILFPYARRVISDVTRDGGFPPLMLAPIDFYGLYMQKKSQQDSEFKAENDNLTIN
jgi:preprotein translocase subunit SecB